VISIFSGRKSAGSDCADQRRPIRLTPSHFLAKLFQLADDAVEPLLDSRPMSGEGRRPPARTGEPSLPIPRWRWIRPSARRGRGWTRAGKRRGAETAAAKWRHAETASARKPSPGARRWKSAEAARAAGPRRLAASAGVQFGEPVFQFLDVILQALHLSAQFADFTGCRRLRQRRRRQRHDRAGGQRQNKTTHRTILHPY